jgi:hypothetical protein
VLLKPELQQIQTSVYVYNAHTTETHSGMLIRVDIAIDRKKTTQAF